MDWSREIKRWCQRTGNPLTELAERVAYMLGDKSTRVLPSVYRWAENTRKPTGLRAEVLTKVLAAGDVDVIEGQHDEHDFRLGIPDLDVGRAKVIQCPDCGQLEIWSLWEYEDHGMCRIRPHLDEDGKCPVCSAAPIRS